MSIIRSVGTAVPPFKHEQLSILNFMQQVYALNETDKRKLRFLYQHSGIDFRYSAIPDYSRPANEWKFYSQTENLEPFPSLEQRMQAYQRAAATLSIDAIRNCIDGKIQPKEISHLITVSCTGMSAPGLDLELVELLDLPRTIERSSVNFMGCYAAVHALKIANAICLADTAAKVLIVCTELCTLHFQREPTNDNITSSLLFGDGSAAVLVTGDTTVDGLHIDTFYAELVPQGKKDMAWELSSTGFQMTLSSYIPELIESDLGGVVDRALEKSMLSRSDITQWCIHPGGKRVLEATGKSLNLEKAQLAASYQVLQQYGNMSSPTLLFVLKKILQTTGRAAQGKNHVFAAAFGPGLTMETFTASC